MLGKRGAVLVFVVLTVVSAACSGGPTAKITTPLPTAEFEADKKLILELWRGLSDAWGNGDTPEQINAGFQSIVDATYPGSNVTVSSCKANVMIDPSIEITQLRAEEVVDQSTIERDDGWVVPGGELDGIAPKGRIYIMSVGVTLTVNNISDVRSETVHVAILDGRAYHFPGCV